ncbi:hypothetical protein QF20_004873 [Salmonella enterica subsp. enterica]|uniref:DprA winged helix domain-containing protein n=3 Tax=Salmonella enterica TaxID=28901 RepID=A0A379SH73_SALER|nr:hypothetical protein [Salmonella enterica]EAA4188704.1 hypothetical protein [Salmonella enterica subsp. enterica serovar Mikawasima]EAC0381729.1 hypothetical protein [Salmonella enterica subsp. enterica serovar Potsdam]EBR8658821.1 hypothetical protein [Salmonella enterica subsp. enterica serovar Kottbus]EBS1713765.1 hypothetical protein [Salmonella enterica subsp. enterica serovar Vitkin]EBS5861146.1 hypothetical protein [Salmonella enterica subsp. enterica serovar Richmond]EBW5295452.1 h
MEQPAARILNLLCLAGKLPAGKVAEHPGITPAEALHQLHGLEVRAEVSRMNGVWFIRPREARLTPAEMDQVLDVIPERTLGVTVSEITLTRGYSLTQVEQAISRLTHAGRVMKSGYGPATRWAKLRGG